MRGLAAAYVDDETPREEREAIKDQLRAGEIKVIVSIGVMTTGVDIPEIGGIVLARPTKSEMLFVQIIGRGLRTAPGKADCLILDHSDTTLRLGFPTDIHHDRLDIGERHKAARPQRSARRYRRSARAART